MKMLHSYALEESPYLKGLRVDCVTGTCAQAAPLKVEEAPEKSMGEEWMEEVE